MARKGGAAGTERVLSETALSERAEALEALLDRLEGELQDDVALEELDRRAKAVLSVVKARHALSDLRPATAGPKEEDGPMDAADEQALRDRILARLDGLAAELEQKGAVRCPACGGLAPDGDGLEAVVAGFSETA